MSLEVNNNHHQISRRAGVVGALTLFSRIVGLARDVAIAYCFGTRTAADAFYVAFRIPNLLRRLLAEGSLTMAFVPIFTQYLKESREEGMRAANVIFTALVILLTGVVLIGIIGAPWIVRAVAYGFAHDPEKLHLTVTLTRVMFPYIFLASCMALMMGMLNSVKHFTAPAASPILLNLAIICGAALFSRWFAEPTMGLALGVLLGGCTQLAMQVGPLHRRSMVPRLTRRFHHPALRQLIRIMLPSIYGGAVYQLNVIVITLLASFLPSGSVSYLWYADRVTEFPLGIFAVAIATVTLPTLSDHAADADMAAFKATANFSLRIVFAEAIPSTIGIMLLATPIVRLLFEGGAFTSTSTAGTAGALTYFAAGIPFVSGVRNLVPAFYAIKDAKTPMQIATLGLMVNAFAALILQRWFLHEGLAMALAISSAVQFVMLVYCLRRRLGRLGMRGLLHGVGGCCLAGVGMAVVVIAVGNAVHLPSALGRAPIAWRLGVVITAGAAVYGVLLRWFAPTEYQHFCALFFRRHRRPV